MTDVFVSYAREDQARVGRLVDALEGQGWSVFWDRRIPAGRTWRTSIGKSLHEARCVVVLWSQHSIQSDWVIEEAEESKGSGLLVPALLDPVLPPMGFRSLQAADLTNWAAGHATDPPPSFFDDIRSILTGVPASSRQPSSVPVDSRKGSGSAEEWKRRKLTIIASVSAAVLIAAAAYVGLSTSNLHIDNAGCKMGFVPRQAVPGDNVCVTQQTRQQVLNDNAQADLRKVPMGGAYGPDTCVTGYVWREASPSDTVCVFPEIRDQTRADNMSEGKH